VDEFIESVEKFVNLLSTARTSMEGTLVMINVSVEILFFLVVSRKASILYSAVIYAIQTIIAFLGKNLPFSENNLIV